MSNPSVTQLWVKRKPPARRSQVRTDHLQEECNLPWEILHSSATPDQHEERLCREAAAERFADFRTVCARAIEDKAIHIELVRCRENLIDGERGQNVEVGGFKSSASRGKHTRRTTIENNQYRPDITEGSSGSLPKPCVDFVAERHHCTVVHTCQPSHWKSLQTLVTLYRAHSAAHITGDFFPAIKHLTIWRSKEFALA